LPRWSNLAAQRPDDGSKIDRRRDVFDPLKPRIWLAKSSLPDNTWAMGVTSRSNLGNGAAFGLALALMAGCGGSNSPPAERGNVVLRDANNYQSTSSLSVPTVETAPATDLDICWSTAVTDIQCHPVMPVMDLDNVSLLRLHLSETEVETRLTAGQLAQSEVDGYLDYRTDKVTTCMKLSQFSFFGTVIKVQEEYIESAERTYMLLFTKGTKPGVGARTMTFIRPTAQSTNTKVDAPTGCGMLQFSADLASAARVDIPAAGPWVVDWADVTRDGQGNPVVFEQMDGLVMGYYEGKTAADLEANIFDIELIATSLWDLRLLGGRKVDLAMAKDRMTGATFGGFEGRAPGVWMLGLTCSSCQNPAPIVLSILNPTAGGS
jgi:hypothetical protein